MPRSSHALPLLAAGALLAACSDAVPTAPADTPQLARTSGPSDSRTRWTFEQIAGSAFQGDGKAANGTTRPDGASIYEDAQCGVATRIFWFDASASRSGDATLALNGRTSCPRTTSIALGGTMHVVRPPHVNAIQVMQLDTAGTAGSARQQVLRMTIGLRNCERLVWGIHAAPGSGSPTASAGGVIVRRLAGTPSPTSLAGYVLGKWQVTTAGVSESDADAGKAGAAQCQVLQNGAWTTLSTHPNLHFTAIIDEMR